MACTCWKKELNEGGIGTEEIEVAKRIDQCKERIEHFVFSFLVKLIYTYEMINCMVKSSQLISMRSMLLMCTIVKLGEMSNHVYYHYFGGFALLNYLIMCRVK
jgi:hypothetical protein